MKEIKEGRKEGRKKSTGQGIMRESYRVFRKTKQNKESQSVQ